METLPNPLVCLNLIQFGLPEFIASVKSLIVCRIVSPMHGSKQTWKYRKIKIHFHSNKPIKIRYVLLLIVHNWRMWNIGKFTIYLVLHLTLIFKHIRDHHTKSLIYESNYLKLNHTTISRVLYVVTINKKTHSNFKPISKMNAYI